MEKQRKELLKKLGVSTKEEIALHELEQKKAEEIMAAVKQLDKDTNYSGEYNMDFYDADCALSSYFLGEYISLLIAEEEANKNRESRKVTARDIATRFFSALRAIDLQCREASISIKLGIN